MTSEAERLNRIADANRRQDEILAALERIELLLRDVLEVLIRRIPK